MKLQKIETIELEPTAPFYFDPTFHKPDHFTSGDNYWEPGIRWQARNWSGECLGLKIMDKGTADKPKLQIELFAAQKIDAKVVSSLIEEFKYRYNLELDLTGFYHKFSEDKVFGPITCWQKLRPKLPDRARATIG